MHHSDTIVFLSDHIHVHPRPDTVLRTSDYTTNTTLLPGKEGSTRSFLYFDKDNP